MANTYRFGDASRPGLLIGLAGRQAVPLVGGVLWMAFVMQTPAPVPVVLAGPAVAVVVAFGRFRGAPLSEVFAPGMRLVVARQRNHSRWVRHSLLGAGPGYETDLPEALADLEILEAPVAWLSRPVGMAVVRDLRAGTVTAAVRVTGTGFPLSAPNEQDALVASWGAALAPLARERTPVVKVAWQEWAHAVGGHEHRAFLTELDICAEESDFTRDYLTLVDRQGGSSVRHEVLITLTVDQRRVRRRKAVAPFDSAVDALVDETRLLADRLATAGLAVGDLLSPAELSTALRLRSDPTRANQVTTLSRSLAAASGRAAIEWGPMTVEQAWSHATVDRSMHRTYRVASWPMLPVGADWLAPLLGTVGATRTVTVVMQPIPMSRAARGADREVMNREADADMKERRGFRVSAQDRKRLADVMTRESELTEGHPEFRFIGLVDVTAPDADALDDACALVEQSAAQSLVDIRPLEARHDLGWVANLPLGRDVTPGALR